MKVNLIKSEIEKITEPGDYRDLKLPGFIMTVAVNKKIDKDGKEHAVISRYFKVNARVKGGKPITCLIGHYGKITPAQARDDAAKCLAQMKEGINPNEQFKKMKEAEKAQEQLNKLEREKRAYTLRNALNDYLSFRAPSKADRKQAGELSPETVKLYRSMIEVHLKDWLERPIADLSRDMIIERYQYVCQKSMASAGNTFRVLRGIINWVIERHAGKYVTANPVSVLSALSAWKEVKPRKEIIPDTKLKAWWLEVSKSEYGYHSDYFKLLLLTGLRKNELAGMKWADVDFDNRYWTVRNTKNGKDHFLPFTYEVEKILSRRYSERTQDLYVFPGKGADGCIRDVEHAQKRIIEATGIAFHPHDLRRTFISVAAREVSDYIVKRFANHHNSQNVTDGYVVLKDAEALRPALQSVEDFIMGYVNLGNENNKVVSINLSRGNSISKPAKN